jgi:hypothetical protein
MVRSALNAIGECGHRLAHAKVQVSQCCNQPIIHPVGGAQPEFLPGFVEHINRTGLGVRKLDCRA